MAVFLINRGDLLRVRPMRAGGPDNFWRPTHRALCDVDLLPGAPPFVF